MSIDDPHAGPRPHVAVCGPRDCTEEEGAAARAVGRLLAERDAIVVCGGYSGVMAEVSRGAREAGGTVVGVLSGRDRAGANPYLSVVIPTGLGEARNAVIVNCADAVIVIGGSWGTLSEAAFAARRGDVPVVVLGGWRVTDRDGTPIGGFIDADNPADAVRLALA